MLGYYLLFLYTVISQNDFLSAVELIFSSLEANESALLSPLASQKEPSSHLEIIFNRSSLHELASLTPDLRRKKLEALIDRLLPESLFNDSASFGDFLSQLFEMPESPSSLVSPSTPPVLPLRSVPKPIPKPHTMPNLPPPLPPKQATPTSCTDKRSNGMDNGYKSEDDSDSDFEDVNALKRHNLHKAKPSSSSLAPPTNHDATSNNRNSDWMKVSRPCIKKPHKPSIKRSMSCDLLDVPGDSTDSSENSSGYSFPFQHVQAWRNLIGLRDSSVLTGSLPRIHTEGSFDEESIYYIAPNEFRSILSQVRGESMKVGGLEVTERAIQRVDSLVTNHRSSGLVESVEYLSLLRGVDPPVSKKGLLQAREGSIGNARTHHIHPRSNTQKIGNTQRLSYENQTKPFPKRRSSTPKETMYKTHSASPLSSISSLPFDDPQYGRVASHISDIYNIPETSPSPPPRQKANSKQDAYSHGFVPITSTGKTGLTGLVGISPVPGSPILQSNAPALPPKSSNKVDIQIRDTPPLPPPSSSSPKPIPKPRLKKDSSSLTLGTSPSSSIPPPLPPFHPKLDSPLETPSNLTIAKPSAEADTVPSPAYFSLKRVR